MFKFQSFCVCVWKGGGGVANGDVKLNTIVLAT